MPEDLIILFYLIVLSIIVSSIIVTPALLWRAYKGKPLLGPKKELDSPALIYYGIFLFIGLGILSFAENKPNEMGSE